MPQDEREQLFKEPAKVANLVNSVAKFFSVVLEIKDADTGSTKPLVEVLREELIYYLALTRPGDSHNGSVRHQMQELFNMYSFVKNCEDLAERMLSAACEMINTNNNIDVTMFTHELPYYNSDQLIVERASRIQHIDVGAIGHRLLVEIEKRAQKYLDDLDNTLCEAAGIDKTDAASKDIVLVNVKRSLAYAIAERIAVFSHEPATDDRLSSRALELMLNDVYERDMPYARKAKEEDERKLCTLLELSKRPNGDAARFVLESNLEELRDIVTNPPAELSMELKQMCNLARLSRAFAEDMDTDVRVGMVCFWAENSRNATSALELALQKLREWIPTQKVASFHNILKWDVASKTSRDISIPSMSFLFTPKCHVCRQSSKRTGLKESGHRSELIVRCVWEMASRGYFSSGVVAAEPVAQVAMDSMVMSRMAAKEIASERDMNNLGFRMLAFIANLYDMEGDHVGKLDHACCNLSKFSCLELETVFDQNSNSIGFLCEMLTLRTRHYMSYKPDESYKSFVTDAIGMLLPIVYKRRNRLGIPRTMRSNGFLDVLCTIPKVRRWTANQGTLRLALDDIRQGHASVRSILDDLHKRGCVVTRTGTIKNKRPVTYVFDSLGLWKLFNQHAALPASSQVCRSVMCLVHT